MVNLTLIEKIVTVLLNVLRILIDAFERQQEEQAKENEMLAMRFKDQQKSVHDVIDNA